MTDPNLLAQVSSDRALGSALLFSHRHPEETPPAHIEIIDLWRCRDECVVIEASRQFGKTTLAEEFLIMEGCFGNFNYCLLLGETFSKACERIEAIDYECRTNVKLHRLFGGKVLARKSIENKIWFRSGAYIECVGWEQELQSFKHRTNRPDLLYLDDPENLERVRDSGAVDASMKKLFLELIPAMDKSRRRLRLTQTRRAEDCMVTRLAKNNEWLYRAYPVCNGDPDDPATVSNWPGRYSMEWIRREKASYQAAGMLAEFKQAYLLQASDPAKKPFKEGMLGAMDVSPWHWMPRYVIYDPSRTSNATRTKEQGQSDRTGKVVVSRLGSKILVHESSGNYWQPNEFIADVFAAHDTHRPAKIGIEKNSLDDWLLQPIRLEMLRRASILPLQALQAPQDRSKESFIMGLQPFAEAKDIVLIGGKLAHPQLVAEWTNFPAGPRDVMNALAYSLRMFAGTPVYEDFSGANIGEAPTPRSGESLYVGFQGTPNECVAVAMVRDGRRLSVAKDWSASGALSDAVKTIVFEIRASFPRAHIEAWVPADTFDQWQRVALVSALRAEKLSPLRGEHVAVARGCLADRIRTIWHGARLLTVDKDAHNTLNALAAGYAFPAERGGRRSVEPESGLSRLVAEALEAVVIVLDRSAETEGGFPRGANIEHTPSGAAYVSANPRRA